MLVNLPKMESAENLSFLLYLMPIVMTAGYTLVLWASKGLTLNIPLDVYLSITKNPYLFLVGLTSVSLAVLVDVYGSSKEKRYSKLQENHRQIQILATICLISVVFCLWNVIGFSINSKFIQILLEGKYSLLFPLLLFIQSLLINPNLETKIKPKSLIENLSIILILGSPIILYILWRFSLSWVVTVSIAMLCLVAGSLFLFLRVLNKNK